MSKDQRKKENDSWRNFKKYIKKRIEGDKKRKAPPNPKTQTKTKHEKTKERKRLMKMYLWWNLCTLYLLACQMRVPVGDLGLCCCVCVMLWNHTNKNPQTKGVKNNWVNWCSKDVTQTIHCKIRQAKIHKQRESTAAQKTSHKHNNKNLNHLR